MKPCSDLVECTWSLESSTCCSQVGVVHGSRYTREIGEGWYGTSEGSYDEEH